MTLVLEDCYRRLGALVRKHRQRHGLTQNDVAQMVGLTHASICHLEAGEQRVPLHTAEKIARLLRFRMTIGGAS